MELRKGKCPGDADYDVLLTGATRVEMLDDETRMYRPLCVYLPGALTEAVNAPGVYEVLHDIRSRVSRNRGDASGSKRIRSNQTRSYPVPVPSAVIGASDPQGQHRYCRLTSWTGANLPRWEMLQPLLRVIAEHFYEQVPERYAAQLGVVNRTDPAWVVPGTPFSTVTVNNSYPTGTHKDAGDLDEGFSTIAVLRRGGYTGGRLVFPQHRLAVDLKHGDLILMDAHEWHGNTLMHCACHHKMNGYCEACTAERISLVAYYRTRLAQCGTPAQELRKADQAVESAEQAAASRFAAGKEQ
jgi:hypothetical protein